MFNDNVLTTWVIQPIKFLYQLFTISNILNIYWSCFCVFIQKFHSNNGETGWSLYYYMVSLYRCLSSGAETFYVCNISALEVVKWNKTTKLLLCLVASVFLNTFVCWQGLLLVWLSPNTMPITCYQWSCLTLAASMHFYRRKEVEWNFCNFLFVEAL